MKTALITGSSGFIGRHFAEHLLKTGWGVDEVDIAGPTYHDAFNVFHATQLSRQYDLVVHAAAYGPNRKAIDAHADAIVQNVALDAKMFRWAIATAQPRVIYFSSSAVYSHQLRHPQLGSDVRASHWRFEEPMGFLFDPFDDYGETKRIGEKMAAAVNKHGGTTVTVVRPFSGYGTDQSEDFPFGAFLGRARRLEDPFKIWGSGAQVRDFIHVDDIVRGTLALVEAKVTTPINLCTGVATSMTQLAEMICTRAGYKPLFTYDRREPGGVDYRVGDPNTLVRWYEPMVLLEEGIDRAMMGT